VEGRKGVASIQKATSGLAVEQRLCSGVFQRRSYFNVSLVQSGHLKVHVVDFWYALPKQSLVAAIVFHS
jgi:hypothetical protein